MAAIAVSVHETRDKVRSSFSHPQQFHPLTHPQAADLPLTRLRGGPG